MIFAFSKGKAELNQSFSLSFDLLSLHPSQENELSQKLTRDYPSFLAHLLFDTWASRS